MKPTAQRRRDRRATLDNLLARLLRGVISPTEAALAVEYIREEQRVYDQTSRSLGETTAALTKNRQAADAAIVEAEQRAKQAERQLAGYVAVFGPNAVDDFHAMQHRAKQAEKRLDRVRSMVTAWQRQLPAAIRTATAAEAVRRAADGDDSPVMFEVTPARSDVKQRADCTETEWAEQERARMERLYTRESSRADAADARAEAASRVGTEYLARADRAEAALGRVRDAQRLGEALAAVAEFDGLTPEAARASAAYAEAADSTEARLAEQQREHEIALATVRKTLSESETLGHRLLQRAERAEYDAGRAERDVRIYRARLDRLGRIYAEQAEARRCEIKRAEDDARREHHRAERYRTAWFACRRDRKADRAAMAAELPLVQTGRMALTLSGLTTTEAVASVRQWAAAGIRSGQIQQRR